MAAMENEGCDNTPETKTADDFIGKSEKKLHLLNVNARTNPIISSAIRRDVMRNHRTQLAQKKVPPSFIC